MELLIFGAIFTLLHVINLVFFSLRFDKNQLVFSVLEILFSTMGIGMAIAFLTSFFTNSSTQMAMGYSFSSIAYALSIVLTIIKQHYKSKFKWCKYAIIGISTAGIILTIVFAFFV